MAAVRQQDDWVLLKRSQPPESRGMGILARCVARLLGSRPELVVRSRTPEPALGEDLILAWEFYGTLRGLRSLEVTLEGLEEARPGDRELPEESCFARILVGRPDHPEAMRRGGARATVPRDSVPSFSAPHNRILWRVRVQGRMRFGPDLDEKFELRVLPLPLGAQP